MSHALTSRAQRATAHPASNRPAWERATYRFTPGSTALVESSLPPVTIRGTLSLNFLSASLRGLRRAADRVYPWSQRSRPLMPCVLRVMMWQLVLLENRLASGSNKVKSSRSSRRLASCVRTHQADIVHKSGDAGAERARDRAIERATVGDRRRLHRTWCIEIALTVSLVHRYGGVQ